MSIRTSGLCVGMLAWMAAIAGCGSEDPQAGEPVRVDPTLQIFFPKLYSAYIEGSSQEFQVPAVVGGVKPDSWECSEPGAVNFDADAVQNGVMITMRKAGTFKIRAISGRQYGEVELVVSAATEDQLGAGEDRYNNQVRLNWGGIGRPMTSGGLMVMQDASCKNCHGSGADALAVEHTPQQTGGYSDEEIRAIFSMGMKPPGSQYGSFPGIAMFYPLFHRWEATEEQYQGLVVYLRSLKPVSQGPLDFMGLLDRIRQNMSAGAGGAGGASAGTAGAVAAGASGGQAGSAAGAGGEEGEAGAGDEGAAGAGDEGAAGAGGEAAAGASGDAAAGASGAAAGEGGAAAGEGGEAASGSGGAAAGAGGA